MEREEEMETRESSNLCGSVFHQTDQKHVFSPDRETILKDFITQRLWVEASATRDPLGREEQGGRRSREEGVQLDWELAGDVGGSATGGPVLL